MKSDLRRRQHCCVEKASTYRTCSSLTTHSDLKLQKPNKIVTMRGSQHLLDSCAHFIDLHNSVTPSTFRQSSAHRQVAEIRRSIAQLFPATSYA
uniref:Uncharacterized protein n=1 Tax=Steinernema glaseri TaxID=37863 RepID=A0A1I8A6J8_9BILA